MDQDRIVQEAENIFRALNEVNRQYAMGVLQSLAFAQKVGETDCSGPVHPESDTWK